MQTLPTYPASFPALIDAGRVWIARLAAYFLKSGVADPAQMRREALGTIGHAARQGIFIIGGAADLAFIGAALILVLYIALHLLHAPHPDQPPIR